MADNKPHVFHDGGPAKQAKVWLVRRAGTEDQTVVRTTEADAQAEAYEGGGAIIVRSEQILSEVFGVSS